MLIFKQQQQQINFLSYLEIVKDVTKEILR